MKTYQTMHIMPQPYPIIRPYAECSNRAAWRRRGERKLRPATSAVSSCSAVSIALPPCKSESIPFPAIPDAAPRRKNGLSPNLWRRLLFLTVQHPRGGLKLSRRSSGVHAISRQKPLQIHEPRSQISRNVSLQPAAPGPCCSTVTFHSRRSSPQSHLQPDSYLRVDSRR